MKILLLSFTFEDIGVAIVTNINSENHKYYCLYFFLITLYPSFMTFL